MAAGSSSVSPSTNGDINALLSGSAWSTGNLTFSFPSSASFYNYSNTTTNEPSHGFQAITEESPPNIPDAVRVALDRYSAVANVTFTLTTETSSTHADIRFAMSNFDAGGRGYFPGDPPAQSGDVWFSTQSAWSEVLDIGPDDGTSAFLDVMHEIGHALGLSHVGPSMDPAHVGWDYTIMSYQSFPNAPSLLSGEPAQTPMLADVAAVQYMYGANFSTNSGNTIYRWSPTSGQML